MRRLTAVRLPDEVVRRLDVQAERRIVSRNYLIGRACEQLLHELEDQSDVLDNEARRW